MSERGTFVTSFLYDGNLVPILQATLPQLTGRVIECIGKVMDTKRPVWFAGQIKGSWTGEEVVIVERWVKDVLLLALPEKHGLFSIVVMPDCYTTAPVKFTIKDRKTT